MATCTTERFIGQGKVYVAPRANNGAINGGWQELGDTELLEVRVSEDFVDDYESCSGNRSIALHVPIKTDWEFSVEAKSFSKENLARAFRGTTASVGSAGNSVVAKDVLSYGPGQIIPLGHLNIKRDILSGNTTLVVKANGGGTTIDASAYTLDEANGTITFKEAHGVVGGVGTAGTPVTFEVSYDYENEDTVHAGTTTIAEYAFRFEGINLATKKAVVVNMHRVSLNLTEVISWIGTEVNRFPMKGMLLPDTTAASGESQYMTIQKAV